MLQEQRSPVHLCIHPAHVQALAVSEVRGAYLQRGTRQALERRSRSLHML